MGKKFFCACIVASLVICEGAQAGRLEFNSTAVNRAPVNGSSQTFSYAMSDDPLGHSASATVEFSGGQLHITLWNTSTQAPRSDDFRGPDSGNVSWLTGLFFNIEGASITDGGSASGPMVWAQRDGSFFELNAGDADPGAFWAFRDDVSDSDFGEFAHLFGNNNQQYGLGAAGLGIFGANDILEPGATPGENNPPNGASGGVLPDLELLDDPGLALPIGHREHAYMRGMIEFWFDVGRGEGLITDVAFVWGSDLAQGLVLVPLPAALPMGLAGLAGVVFLRRRAARAKRAA